MCSQHCLEVLSATGSMIQALAVSVATVFAILEWRKAQRRRDKEAFEVPHGYYTRYEELTVMYPELDMGDLPLPKPVKLTPKQKSQAVGMFLMWLAMVQQAFALYQNVSEKATNNRWTGWEKYILENMARENFLEYWNLYHHQFDRDFDNYMIKLLKDHNLVSNHSQS